MQLAPQKVKAWVLHVEVFLQTFCGEMLTLLCVKLELNIDDINVVANDLQRNEINSGRNTASAIFYCEQRSLELIRRNYSVVWCFCTYNSEDTLYLG